MKRTGIDKICTYLEEKKLSVEEVIRIAFYAGNLEGNKEIIVLFPAIVSSFLLILDHYIKVMIRTASKARF